MGRRREKHPLRTKGEEAFEDELDEEEFVFSCVPPVQDEARIAALCSGTCRVEAIQGYLLREIRLGKPGAHVVNVEASGLDKRVSSWIGFYYQSLCKLFPHAIDVLKMTIFRCSNQKCVRVSSSLGGHVTMEDLGGERHFIRPLCPSCNHPSNTSSMDLRPNTIFMEIVPLLPDNPMGLPALKRRIERLLFFGTQRHVSPTPKAVLAVNGDDIVVEAMDGKEECLVMKGLLVLSREKLLVNDAEEWI